MLLHLDVMRNTNFLKIEYGLNAFNLLIEVLKIFVLFQNLIVAISNKKNYLF